MGEPSLAALFGAPGPLPHPAHAAGPLRPSKPTQPMQQPHSAHAVPPSPCNIPTHRPSSRAVSMATTRLRARSEASTRSMLSRSLNEARAADEQRGRDGRQKGRARATMGRREGDGDGRERRAGGREAAVGGRTVTWQEGQGMQGARTAGVCGPQGSASSRCWAGRRYELLKAMKAPPPPPTPSPRRVLKALLRDGKLQLQLEHYGGVVVG